tara:strand:- start:579 stop:722 length:144 start_codon:yes stop_codon:yes gene_type:complete
VASITTSNVKEVWITFTDVTATLDAIKISNSSDANWSGGNVSIAYRV